MYGLTNLNKLNNNNSDKYLRGSKVHKQKVKINLFVGNALCMGVSIFSDSTIIIYSLYGGLNFIRDVHSKCQLTLSKKCSCVFSCQGRVTLSVFKKCTDVCVCVMCVWQGWVPPQWGTAD